MSRFELSGGALCLDFVNTLGDRPLCDSEQLNRPEDLLDWAEAAGLIEPEDRRPITGTLLDRAVALRETIYRIVSALAAGERPAADDLAELNRAVAEALPRLRLEPDDAGGFDWAWSGRSDDPRRILWAVASSTADLLVSDEVSFIRECASDRCSWTFVDRSRNRRRRWCDMKTCGNRAKARRHYRRRKQRAAAG